MVQHKVPFATEENGPDSIPRVPSFSQFSYFDTTGNTNVLDLIFTIVSPPIKQVALIEAIHQCAWHLLKNISDHKTFL